MKLEDQMADGDMCAIFIINQVKYKCKSYKKTSEII